MDAGLSEEDTRSEISKLNRIAPGKWLQDWLQDSSKPAKINQNAGLVHGSVSSSKSNSFMILRTPSEWGGNRLIIPRSSVRVAPPPHLFNHLQFLTLPFFGLGRFIG
jgi:hypothetical protein